MKEAQFVPKRPLADLAEPHGVTRAAIYAAARRGHIPVIPAGTRLNITQAAYEYHARFGYGPQVPAYGTPEAREYAAARSESEDAA